MGQSDRAFGEAFKNQERMRMEILSEYSQRHAALTVAVDFHRGHSVDVGAVEETAAKFLAFLKGSPDV